ncbi:MAG TPA: ATP-binding protein [Candidatus Glassbacteria bacterium]|nr:ATP-binding protein [Candidatus Glassbacteria bacterium]
MTNYLAAYGTISQAAGEAVDQVLGLKAKIKGKCFGPSHELQEEVRGIYRREIDERLQLIGRLIVELGDNRPHRFAVALSRLSLNLGECGEQLVELLYLPGYRNLQKMAIALLDHLQRTLVYFRKTLTNKEDPTTVNVNYLLRDIVLACCPWRSEFLPAGDQRSVTVSFREKLSEDVPHMVGEAEAVYLSLYQIVSNAVTASRNGGTVSTYTQYYERFRQMQITIADTGPGVDRIAVLKSALETEVVNPKEADGIRQDTSDHNNRVFALMFKPRVSGFSYQNGSFKGIGLALARDEITRHRGKIEVYSKPGRGTTIQVFFTVK